MRAYVCVFGRVVDFTKQRIPVSLATYLSLKRKFIKYRF